MADQTPPDQSPPSGPPGWLGPALLLSLVFGALVWSPFGGCFRSAPPVAPAAPSLPPP